jgi:hypothetical protein
MTRSSYDKAGPVAKEYLDFGEHAGAASPACDPLDGNRNSSNNSV